jgi:hypothetical protein
MMRLPSGPFRLLGVRPVLEGRGGYAPTGRRTYQSLRPSLGPIALTTRRPTDDDDLHLSAPSWRSDLAFLRLDTSAAKRRISVPCATPCAMQGTIAAGDSIPPDITDPAFEPKLRALLDRCSDGRSGADLDRAQLLINIHDLFDRSSCIRRLNPKFQRAIFQMLTTNLFRYGIKVPAQVETKDYTVSQCDPSWSHLGYCYEIFMKFIEFFPNAEFVNMTFVHRLMALAEAPDVRERLAIGDALKMLFDSKTDTSLEFIRSLRDKLVSVREQRMLPWAAHPLLACARHIIRTTGREYRMPIGNLLMQGIVPLIGIPFLSAIYVDVKVSIVEAVGDLPEYKMPILHEMQCLWPISGLPRTKCIVDLLMTLVMELEKGQFKTIAEPFLAFLAHHITSENMMFCSTILDHLSREDGRQFLKANVHMIQEKCLDALLETAERHWFMEARAKAHSLIKVIRSLTRPENMKLKRPSRRLPPTVENRTSQKWEKIFKAIDWDEMETTEAHNVKELAKLTTDPPEEPGFCNTHFLPLTHAKWRVEH